MHEKSYQGRSYGEEPVEWFAPTNLDIDQWVKACKLGKMEGGWLTTKHHGGFCLWDSEFTDYDVASAPVKTDIVKEFTTKFREAGLKVRITSYNVCYTKLLRRNQRISRKGVW